MALTLKQARSVYNRIGRVQDWQASVNYVGVDISPVMINIATSRLAAWGERAKAVLVDGSLPLPADGGFADRVLSTFVFDLLDEDHARAIPASLTRASVGTCHRRRDRNAEKAPTVTRWMRRMIGRTIWKAAGSDQPNLDPAVAGNMRCMQQ